MSVLERFVFPGILCAAGIYTFRAEWTCLDKEVKELKGSMEKELVYLDWKPCLTARNTSNNGQLLSSRSVQEVRDDRWEEIENVRAIGPCCSHHTRHYTP